MGAGDTGGTGRADVVVLTALEIEYRAVRAHLDDPRPVRAERGSLFETGVHRSAARPGGRRVAIHMTGPGNPGAAALVERAAALFAPRAVLFVGVAGGVKDVALGDVVAADAVYDYETGKDTESGFLPRQKTHQPAYGLVQLARSVAAADDWQRRILPGGGAPRPRAHVKPIAAGGRVVGHERSDVGLRLAAVAGDAIAVDMEGFGFLAGAYVNQHLDALVIRGVSDLLGDKGVAHDEHWQPVASRHAAAFAFELIGRLPGAEAAPGAPARRRAKLTIQELGGLADLLLEVPGLSSPTGWQQLLDELPTVGTAVARQSASRAEALALLRTCEAHRALGELVSVVDVLAPDAPAAAELGRRVEELGLA
ncbi:hypothetical protein ACFZCY_15705 [Streptomyces sp. NPDC007983]|uniref:phosphorylase family protein n=1 Tax=Streptomyces sp. NPDC007983 TaxID=3364800 RepID=UPI0036ED872B